MAARQAGAEVVLLEKADTLLGTGQVGGIMRNNGRFTATEEMIAMGGGDLFKLTDENSRHVNMEFPGHQHANLYDVAMMEPMVARYLVEKGTEVWTASRAQKIRMTDRKIEAIEAMIVVSATRF